MTDAPKHEKPDENSPYMQRWGRYLPCYCGSYRAHFYQRIATLICEDCDRDIKEFS